MNQGFDPSRLPSHHMTPGFLRAVRPGVIVRPAPLDMSGRAASGRPIVVSPARVAHCGQDALRHHGQPVAPTGRDATAGFGPRA